MRKKGHYSSNKTFFQARVAIEWSRQHFVMNHAPKFKRWYERQPHLFKAVKLLVVLPDEIKSIVGEGLLLLAEQEFGSMIQSSVRSKTLGSEKILGLHKSKNKRREYDTNERLHQAMNYLYILPEAEQDAMAEHILQLLQYIQDYFAACKEFQVPSATEDVVVLVNTYVKSGSSAVPGFLKKLRNDFVTRLKETPPPAPALRHKVTIEIRSGPSQTKDQQGGKIKSQEQL